MYKPATIQTATLNARRTSAGDHDLATITLIEMFIPAVCLSFMIIAGTFYRSLYFLIAYIRLCQIRTPRQTSFLDHLVCTLIIEDKLTRHPHC